MVVNKRTVANRNIFVAYKIFQFLPMQIEASATQCWATSDYFMFIARAIKVAIIKIDWQVPKYIASQKRNDHQSKMRRFNFSIESP